MDTDLMLVTGIILLVMSIPSMLSAFTESRVPRLAILVLVVAGVLIFMAINDRSGGYTFPELPQVFARVFGRLVN